MSGVLVHEWLAAHGGSENVFEVLSEVFPDAQRWCLWDDSAGRFDGVRETILARTPLRHTKAGALPVMPAVWRHLPATTADWLLCSSHAFAHHARFRGPAREAPKLVYAHTPARYMWAPELDGRGVGWAARIAAGALRPLDVRRAREPIAIAANSKFVAQRIADCWQRQAEVIYPPVDVQRLLSAETELTETERAEIARVPSEFVIATSRFVPYKRLEAAVDVGLAVGIPVVLAGSGPDEARLRALAEHYPGCVFVVTEPSSALLRALLRKARALVFAPIEDFGIVPVEAMALGTPGLVSSVGGATESIVHGVTGAHVRDWKSPADLREAFDIAVRSDPSALHARALEFDTPVFAARIKKFVVTATSSADPAGTPTSSINPTIE